jgi:hypothetical protein
MYSTVANVVGTSQLYDTTMETYDQAPNPKHRRKLFRLPRRLSWESCHVYVEPYLFVYQCDYLSHTDDAVRLYLQGTFTFRLLTSEASVALTTSAKAETT